MEPQQASDNGAEPVDQPGTDVDEGAVATVAGVQPGEAAASPAARDRLETWLRQEVLDRPGGFLVDLGALVAAAWLLWWLSDDDGGLRNTDLWRPSLFVMLLTPFLAEDWARAPRPVRILLVWLPLGALVSFAFAVDRSRFVGDALTFGMLPGLVLAGSRLARRAWTTYALLAIVVVGFSSWSWLAGLKWWGWTDLGLQPRWELLSWRNQSGILTAGFGAWLAGICLVGRRSPSLVAGAATALAMAGAWLSSSRAAIVFGVFGLLVVAWLTVWSREKPERARSALSVGGRLVGIGGASVAIVLALQLMLPATATTPLESRGEDQAVEANAIARTKHWEAAAGMFTDRPPTGTGIGSFRAMIQRYNPPDGNLTASAHSAWFEGLAEGGLAFGLPLIALGGIAGLGVLRLPGRLREQADPTVGDSDGAAPFPVPRRAVLVGAAGAGATVVAHASIDFNLRYATLLGLASITLGFVLAQWADEDDAPTLRGRVPGTALLLVPALLLAVGQAGASRERAGAGSIDGLSPMEVATKAAPWNTTGRVYASELLADQGELEAARAAAEGPVAWNPGDPVAQMNLARIRYRLGELTSGELLAMLEEPPTVLNQWPRTAEALFDGGDYRDAELVARRAIEFHPEYAAWGIDGNVARGWRVLIEIGTLARGCAEGEALLQQARDQEFDPEGRSLEALEEWFTEELCPAG